MIDAFERHIQEVCAIVSTWPLWKQNILGTPKEGDRRMTPEQIADVLTGRGWSATYHKGVDADWASTLEAEVRMAGEGAPDVLIERLEYGELMESIAIPLADFTPERLDAAIKELEGE